MQREEGHMKGKFQEIKNIISYSAKCYKANRSDTQHIIYHVQYIYVSVCVYVCVCGGYVYVWLVCICMRVCVWWVCVSVVCVCGECVWV